ncbi:hypothetical protein GCM10027436_32080 [Actinophytocola sediminis]
MRDDSWMEVFTSVDDTIAIVRASGPDYPHALTDALSFPRTEDKPGDVLVVDSGELAPIPADTGHHPNRLIPAFCRAPVRRTHSTSAGTPPSAMAAASHVGSSHRHEATIK